MGKKALPYWRAIRRLEQTARACYALRDILLEIAGTPAADRIWLEFREPAAVHMGLRAGDASAAIQAEAAGLRI